MLSWLRRPCPAAAAAEAVYHATLAQARAPAFYGPGRAPDTVAGRFEVLVLHVGLVLARLRGEGEEAQELSQAVFDVFFSDMDGALRELGVGDTSVGKRIRKMGEAFYGRARAYDAALESGEEGALAAALERNLYAHAPAEPAAVAAMAAYARASAACLAEQPAGELLAGRQPRFAEP
ncbi:MAG: ubiquinol-cytochrome C reductase [Caulobacterales bacterium]|nr:ubiquinol-cytochrome C reductase [Caulobacterales bacterium]